MTAQSVIFIFQTQRPAYFKTFETYTCAEPHAGCCGAEV